MSAPDFSKEEHAASIIIGSMVALSGVPEALQECNECLGTGWKLDEAKQARQCPCTKLKRAKWLAKFCGIPMQTLHRHTVTGMTANNHTYKASLAEVKTWLQNYRPENHRGLLMWGRAGSGKTRLLHACIRYLTINKLLKCTYFDSRTFFQLLRSTYDANHAERPSESEALESFASPLVVALDEFVKPRTDWERETLFFLINERYKRGNAMLIATNYTPEQMADEFDERVISRLHEMCSLLPVEGEDFRKSATQG